MIKCRVACFAWVHSLTIAYPVMHISSVYMGLPIPDLNFNCDANSELPTPDFATPTSRLTQSASISIFQLYRNSVIRGWIASERIITIITWVITLANIDEDAKRGPRSNIKSNNQRGGKRVDYRNLNCDCCPFHPAMGFAWWRCLNFILVFFPLFSFYFSLFLFFAYTSIR